MSNNEEINFGGINEFKFIYENQLADKIEIIRGQATQIPILQDFTIGILVAESSKFTEDKINLNLFEYKFTGKIAKDNYSKIQDCLFFDTNKIVALVKDNNKQTRILGQKGNACEMTVQFDKGQNVASLNHYAVEIKWKSKYRAAILNDEYIIPTFLGDELGNYLGAE